MSRTAKLRRWIGSWSGLATLLVIGAAGILSVGLVSTFHRPPLTPDSWAYLLLARSFRSTPYHLPLVRQYQYVTDFSDSFPPVWPLVMAGLSYLLPDGPWLGVAGAALLSVLLLPLFHLLLRPLIRAKGRRRFAACASWAAVLSYAPFLDEILAGRTMAAALCCYLAIGIVLTRMARASWRTGLAVGALAGLLWMTRFDAAPVIVVLGIGIPFAWRSKPSVSWLAGYAVAVGLIIAPWILYSRAAFGVPFASDNAMVAKSAATNFVNNWYPVFPPTLFQAPLVWLRRVWVSVPLLAAAVRRGTLRYAYATSLLVLFALWTRVRPGSRLHASSRQRRIALVIMAAFLLQLVGPLATGFFELRYFTPMFMAAATASLVWLMNARPGWLRPMAALPLVVGLVLGWRKSLGADGILDGHASFTDVRAVERGDRSVPFAGIPLGVLDRCLPPRARVLTANTGVSAYQIGYYLGRTGLELPNNWTDLSTSARSQFLATFRVTDIVGSPDTMPAGSGRTRAIPGCVTVLQVLPVAAAPAR